MHAFLAPLHFAGFARRDDCTLVTPAMQGLSAGIVTAVTARKSGRKTSAWVINVNWEEVNRRYVRALRAAELLK